MRSALSESSLVNATSCTRLSLVFRRSNRPCFGVSGGREDTPAFWRVFIHYAHLP